MLHDIVHVQVSRFSWYYILTGDLASSYVLTAKELPPSHFTFPSSSLPGPTVAFQYTLDGSVTKIQEFGSPQNFGPDTKLNITQCGKSNFQYWVIPPYLTAEFVLLGELNKITPVSEVRFGDITINDDDIMVKVNGVPSEKVPVTVYNKLTNKIQVLNCTISMSGTNRLSLHTGQCNGV